MRSTPQCRRQQRASARRGRADEHPDDESDGDRYKVQGIWLQGPKKSPGGVCLPGVRSVVRRVLFRYLAVLNAVRPSARGPSRPSIQQEHAALAVNAFIAPPILAGATKPRP